MMKNKLDLGDCINTPRGFTLKKLNS